jgi:hypothetical protein
LRYQYDGLADEHLLSPRLALEWRASPRLSLRGTAGLYHALHDKPFDVLPTQDGSSLGAERSREVTLGAAATPRPGWSGGVNVYAKHLDDLVYEPEPARYANGGIGQARGIETFWRFDPPGGRGNFGITYAWSRVRQRDPVAWRREPDWYARDVAHFWRPAYETPYWYRPVQDQPHRLAVDGLWRRGGWEFGARYQLASGRPYTPVVSVATDPLDIKHGIVGAKGSARYPLYKRLDLRVARQLQSGRIHWSLYADVLNATGADNVYQYRYDPQYRVRYTVKMLPVLPTLGVEARF